MKKIIFVVTLFLAVVNIQAQEKGAIEVGGNIGVNFANLIASNNSNQTTNSVTGFNFAVSGEYYFSDRWGIKSKLIYDQKGWADGFFDDENGFQTTTDFKLTYLTLPVMANWHFGSKRNWYLNFGLYLGFLLDAEAEAINRDVSDAFEGTDIGLALGIGYKFEVSENTKLFVEFDGQGAFNDVFKRNDSSVSVKNSRQAINFGVLFSL
ncbi:PorT family protein [Polaribacter batillariae]|uniref:PorT family protein n=1 Tax=Polaribacter batillariae TaxID=2808900 RepID=A0ABX7SUS9_9FLAO|nr:porin family protein [Polaribacter batillariae]QTD37990.1 PorT family protein [Polaribacter batillariae]